MQEDPITDKQTNLGEIYRAFSELGPDKKAVATPIIRSIIDTHLRAAGESTAWSVFIPDVAGGLTIYFSGDKRDPAFIDAFVNEIVSGPTREILDRIYADTQARCADSSAGGAE